MVSFDGMGPYASVELSDKDFWETHNKLAELMKAFVKAGVSYSTLKIEEKEYHFKEISIAASAFHGYIRDSGADSKIYDAAQKFLKENPEFMPLIDESPEMTAFEENKKTHAVEMEFKAWDYVLNLMGAFDEPEAEKIHAEPNDWSPPDNFQNGTDDEREIYEDFHKNNKKS